SDNVLFFIHRESLKYSAARFLPVEFKAIKHEIVPLTETSEVLELLFIFLYQKPLPDVKGLSFEILTHLAEAAEKYQVFSAMMICNMRMTVVFKDHPLDVLRYAVIHHYKELIDIAAPLVIECQPLPETIDRLPPNTIAAWIKYYQQWLDALVKVYHPYSCYPLCSNSHSPRRAKAMEDLMGRRFVLHNVGNILAYYAASGHSAIQEWQYNSLRTMNTITPFSEFLYPNSSS
ncbi:hypothetical protein M378DRAFT_1041840, partial [Amanita muscaria Koide BX008]